jgi:hypothetical protein
VSLIAKSFVDAILGDAGKRVENLAYTRDRTHFGANGVCHHLPLCLLETHDPRAKPLLFIYS